GRGGTLRRHAVPRPAWADAAGLEPFWTPLCGRRHEQDTMACVRLPGAPPRRRHDAPPTRPVRDQPQSPGGTMPWTRRALLTWGLMGAGTTLLPGGRRLTWAEALPPSPRTTPFIVELTRAPDGGLPPIASGEAGADITPVPGGFPTQADPADCV